MAAVTPGAGELSVRLDAVAGEDLRSAGPVEQNGAVSLAASGPGSLLRDRGSLVVDVRVTGDARDRIEGLKDAGARIGAVSSEYGLISVSADERELRGLADAPGVESVTEVLTPMTGGVSGGDAETGAINTCPTGVVSEGNTQLKAGTARTQFDVDGTGIKVGILSDSFNRKMSGTLAPNDVASGDLPGPGNPCGRTTPVQVLDDSAPDIPPPNTPVVGDEGRAMAQIVHDIAPGSTLAFATAFTGDVAFGNNIRALANSGADVIVDDIIYFDEPFYQDGTIANAVRDVTAQGVTYFSMAFNNNRVLSGNDSNSWEAPAYRSATGGCPALAGGPGADCMDFNPGSGTDNTFNVTALPGKTFRFVLQWAEPQNGVTTDLDLYVINQATNPVEGESIDNNPITGKPFEFVSFVPDNGAANNYQIVIRRFSGTGTPRLKWVNGDNGSGSIAGLEYPTSNLGDVIGPTIFGHNGTATAQTVGAVPFSNGSVMESFSSRGPVTHLFAPVNGVTPAAPLASPEILNKPDVSATDGGINTFFGSGNRFFGTSAAAPHAAAVGALQLEANPALTLAQVKSAQMSTADPVGAFPALAQGSGLVDAQAAIAANPPAPPTVTLSSKPKAQTKDVKPSVAFAATGDLSSQTCKVDGGAAKACVSKFKPRRALKDGKHSIVVTATDFFGQSGAATASFKVDTEDPVVKIKKGPKKKSAKRKAKFTFSVEKGAKLECKLDKGKFAKCSSRAKFKVGPGKHKLAVHGTDKAGNVGKDTRYGWKVTK